MKINELLEEKHAIQEKVKKETQHIVDKIGELNAEIDDIKEKYRHKLYALTVQINHIRKSIKNNTKQNSAKRVKAVMKGKGV